jgi:uncharacterized protein (TIGR03067 family)
MTQRLLVVVIAFGSLGSRSGAGDEGTRRDQKLLQGTWKAVSGEAAGKNLPKQRVEDLTVVFSGDKMTVTTSNGSRESTFRLDATKKPKAIDLVDENGQTAPGIYDFEGDTLRMCLNQGGGERPSSFLTKPDTRLRLFVFQRNRR